MKTLREFGEWETIQAYGADRRLSLGNNQYVVSTSKSSFGIMERGLFLRITTSALNRVHTGMQIGTKVGEWNCSAAMLSDYVIRDL